MYCRTALSTTSDWKADSIIILTRLVQHVVEHADGDSGVGVDGVCNAQPALQHSKAELLVCSRDVTFYNDVCLWKVEAAA